MLRRKNEIGENWREMERYGKKKIREKRENQF